jgi:hypothetical protein
MPKACEHGLSLSECFTCASPKHGQHQSAELQRLRAEVEALRADAGRWKHVWQCVRIAQHGEYVLMPDDPTGLAEDSIARARFVREVDAAIAKAEAGNA